MQWNKEMSGETQLQLSHIFFKEPSPQVQKTTDAPRYRISPQVRRACSLSPKLRFQNKHHANYKAMAEAIEGH